jgi:hypothetical protein
LVLDNVESESLCTDMVGRRHTWQCLGYGPFLGPIFMVGAYRMRSEITHSWSGNWVTNALWADFWLNEGTYSTVWCAWAPLGHVPVAPRPLLAGRLLGAVLLHHRPSHYLHLWRRTWERALLFTLTVHIVIGHIWRRAQKRAVLFYTKHCISSAPLLIWCPVKMALQGSRGTLSGASWASCTGRHTAGCC